jgi:MoxR-like ATPase
MLQRQQGSVAIEDLQACISLEEVEALQKAVRQVTLTEDLQRYLLRLVRTSRQDDDITLGVSPRGTVALQRAVQAYAFLEERDYAIDDDVKFVAPHVLAHRLIPASGKQATAIVQRLLDSVPI